MNVPLSCPDISQREIDDVNPARRPPTVRSIGPVARQSEDDSLPPMPEPVTPRSSAAVQPPCTSVCGRWELARKTKCSPPPSVLSLLPIA